MIRVLGTVLAFIALNSCGLPKLSWKQDPTIATQMSYNQAEIKRLRLVGPPETPGNIVDIFDLSCHHCHSSDEGGFGGLNVYHWVAMPDGRYNFYHVVDGVQRDTNTTMTSIVERLADPDENRRMPLGWPMEEQNRETLSQWIKGQIIP